MPEAGSTVSVTIFSGVFAATASMSTPPSVEATKATRPDAAIDQQREIKLACNGRVLDHIDPPHQPALWPGLRRDQRLAEHAVGLGVELLQGLHQLDAATFAPPAGVNLRFDHEGLAAERAGMGGGFVRGLGDAAFGHRRAIGLQQRLGLIFVDVHAEIAAAINGRA